MTLLVTIQHYWEFHGTKRKIKYRYHSQVGRLQVQKEECYSILPPYDPLGLVSPMLLRVNILYRDICDQRLSWNQEIPESMHRRWLSWKRRIPKKNEVQKSLPSLSLPIQTIQLHAFADASKDGTAVAIYAVVGQGKIVERGLLVSKSRFSRKQLSIPRLELVAAHMAANHAWLQVHGYSCMVVGGSTRLIHLPVICRSQLH